MDTLLKKVAELSVNNQRRVAMIVGACVADAAARPTHWQYDVDKLKTQLGDKESTPEFFPENCSMFYSIPTGLNSCYFDITKSSMKSMVENNVTYEWSKLVNGLYSDFFGPSTKYDIDIRSKYSRDSGPVEGRWIEGSLLTFKENRDKLTELPSTACRLGGDSISESDGFCAALPVIARYYGDDQLEVKVEEVIRVLTNWPTALSHGLVAARILGKLLNVDLDGKSMKEIVTDTANEVSEEYTDVSGNIMTVLETPTTVNHSDAVGKMGRACSNPGTVQGALHAALFSKDYTSAVRATILAGGCNCSRVMLLGAMFGARYGMDCIPRDWLDRCTDVEEVINNAISIVAARGD